MKFKNKLGIPFCFQKKIDSMKKNQLYDELLQTSIKENKSTVKKFLE